jgi:glycosyltransferase involved in cell wall biosynthesis
MGETMEKLPDFDFEIVCIDDGSRDNTLEQLIAISKADPRVTVLEFSRNFGKEPAMTAGIDAASGVSIGNSAGTAYVYFDTTNNRVGINTAAPQYDLHIIGELSATNKSFVIDHPTKEGMHLRYGSLEGPENGVYFRGRLKNKNIIELPDYWVNLVDYDSITVTLTPIGRFSELYVENIENNIVYVQDNCLNLVNCYFTVYAERIDIPKLLVEY